MSVIRILQSGKKLRPRDIYDHFPTPSGVVRAAFDGLHLSYEPRCILDHSAGTGVWGAVARTYWPKAEIIGVEIQPSEPPPAYDRWYSEWSFFDYALYARYGEVPTPDLIIGNPPFKYAEQFTRLSLAMLRPGQIVLHYLRLAFLEGQDRGKHLWPVYAPAFVDTLSRRPSHIPGTTKTDSTAYAIFTWQRGLHRPRYSGGWLEWEYEPRIPEEKIFRPRRYLTDETVPCTTLRLEQCSVFAMIEEGKS
jgi:hypothetical protein